MILIVSKEPFSSPYKALPNIGGINSAVGIIKPSIVPVPQPSGRLAEFQGKQWDSHQQSLQHQQQQQRQQNQAKHAHIMDTNASFTNPFQKLASIQTDRRASEQNHDSQHVTFASPREIVKSPSTNAHQRTRSPAKIQRSSGSIHNLSNKSLSLAESVYGSKQQLSDVSMKKGPVAILPSPTKKKAFFGFLHSVAPLKGLSRKANDLAIEGK